MRVRSFCGLPWSKKRIVLLLRFPPGRLDAFVFVPRVASTRAAHKWTYGLGGGQRQGGRQVLSFFNDDHHHTIFAKEHTANPIRRSSGSPAATGPAIWASTRFCERPPPPAGGPLSGGRWGPLGAVDGPLGAPRKWCLHGICLSFASTAGRLQPCGRSIVSGQFAE